MRERWLLFWLILAIMFVLVPILALAKSHSAPSEDENGAIILGEAGERYPIVGSGGIRVVGGHHGVWASNMKSSVIQIDGSAIATQKFLAFNENSDFTAAPNCVFFVSHACVCTMPDPSGSAGQELMVCNSSGNAISYRPNVGGTLFAGGQSEPLVNSAPGKVDRFISDGKSWYRE
jgi:hypothetical protein